ncbi:MAG: hypothetical protein EXR58_01630 [Chloroflexi bacterium]|nr:hypothetical protein [Chloroflexota bacterium]
MSVDAELIRLFYELWEGSLAGREYLEATNPLPESLEKIPRSNAGDVQRALWCINRIGHLVEHGSLPPEFVSSLVGKQAIRALARAEPLVKQTRIQRDEPDHLEYVDKILVLCQQAYPDYEPKYRTEEHRSFGLAP